MCSSEKKIKLSDKGVEAFVTQSRKLTVHFDEKSEVAQFMTSLYAIRNHRKPSPDAFDAPDGSRW